MAKGEGIWVWRNDWHFPSPSRYLELEPKQQEEEACTYNPMTTFLTDTIEELEQKNGASAEVDSTF